MLKVLLTATLISLLHTTATATGDTTGKILKAGPTQEGKGEVIHVKGCEGVLVEGLNNDWCMPLWFAEDLCELNPDICEEDITPNPEVPDPEPGGQPEKPKPTEQACQEAYQKCADDVGNKQQECLTEYAMAAASTAFKGGTCFGNSTDVMESITLTRGIDLPGGGQFPFYKCTRDDLKGTGLLSLGCRLAYGKKVMQQCLDGRKESTSSETTDITFKLDLFGFGELGLGSGKEITITVPKGTGDDEKCAEYRSKVVEACRTEKSKCIAIAKGAESRIVSAETDIDGIVQRVDKQKLGLQTGHPDFQGGEAASVEAGFRSLSKAPTEIQDLYVARITFLANWSGFLQEQNISASNQKKAQKEFENAQRLYEAVKEDLKATLILAFVYNPFEKRAGTDADQKRLLKFIKDKDFVRRSAFVESSMLNKLSGILGNKNLLKFRSQVWPGILEFGSSKPMKGSSQIVTPL
ncbi:MAG: hypothetical protein ACTHJ5_11770 [Ilyomonas sp.]